MTRSSLDQPPQLLRAGFVAFTLLIYSHERNDFTCELGTLLRLPQDNLVSTTGSVRLTSTSDNHEQKTQFFLLSSLVSFLGHLKQPSLRRGWHFSTELCQVSLTREPLQLEL